MFIRFVLRGLMALGLVGMSALPALAADGLDLAQHGERGYPGN